MIGSDGVISGRCTRCKRDEIHLFEVEVRVKNLPLLGLGHNLLTKNLGVLDLPGIDETATEIDIRVHLED